MGIVVPALRLLFVLFNIYDTFKTLKLPPPSSRNNGQPTVRAMSQRKRAMKGCLSVWLIWFCFALYERTADRILGIFIPFYNEIKAIVILFFILTRARGAEPIYLHVLRPLVRPYTETLDMLLEVAQHFGDLIFIFVAVPVHCLSSLHHRWRSPKKEEPECPGEEPPVIPEYQEDVPPELAFGAARTRRRPLQEAHDKAKAGPAPDPVQPAIYAQKSAHDIWHPPTSAYDDSPPTAPKGLPTPPAEDELHTLRDRANDEWRQYEPFPAAYPLSPLQAKSTLPVDLPARLATFSGIYQDSQQASFDSIQQGFQGSLQLPRESANPDSDDDLSDDRHDTAGAHTDDEMSVDEDYEDEDDDDDFNVTLQTPLRITRKKNVSNMTTASVESRSYASTGLSTVDRGSPFRTRTNSEVSATLISSDAVSIAGHKRPLSTAGDDEGRTRPPLKAKISDNGTIRAKPAVRARDRPVFMTRTKSQVEESSASGTENRLEAGRYASVLPKKRHEGVVASKKSPVRRAVLRPGTSTLKPKAPGAQPRVVARKATAVPRATSLRPLAKVPKKPLVVNANPVNSSEDANTQSAGPSEAVVLEATTV